MANQNLISATISPADLLSLQDAIQTLKTKLPFLVNLTPAERISYLKMGDKTVAFVNKSFSYARKNEGLVPPYLDVQEFEKDLNLIDSLTDIAQDLNMLAEGVDDTIMLAGSDAYSAALVFYRSIRIAKQMNLPGIDTIYADLSVRFPGRRQNDTPTAEDDTENPDIETAEEE